VETIGSKRSYALIWCMPNNDDDDDSALEAECPLTDATINIQKLHQLQLLSFIALHYLNCDKTVN